jgi:hypothetical protein
VRRFTYAYVSALSRALSLDYAAIHCKYVGTHGRCGEDLGVEDAAKAIVSPDAGKAGHPSSTVKRQGCCRCTASDLRSVAIRSETLHTIDYASKGAI